MFHDPNMAGYYKYSLVKPPEAGHYMLRFPDNKAFRGYATISAYWSGSDWFYDRACKASENLINSKWFNTNDVHWSSAWKAV